MRQKPSIHGARTDSQKVDTAGKSGVARARSGAITRLHPTALFVHVTGKGLVGLRESLDSLLAFLNAVEFSCRVHHAIENFVMVLLHLIEFFFQTRLHFDHGIGPLVAGLQGIGGGNRG